MLGLPGSGKTTFSKQLEAETELPRFSLDEEYFARVGNTGQEERDFTVEKQVGEEIKARVAGVLASGQSVILDFCPWSKNERDEYREFIDSHGAECHIYFFDVPKNELLRRLKERNNQADQGIQYMTPAMLEDFYARFEPPKGEEVEVVKTN